MNIHLIFKTHLDIGFTDFAQAVTARYMSHFIPGAIALGERLRGEGYSERFVWTTGAWLIYEYLEQAGRAERARMERAIARGDIAWHALPFTTHTELMDASLFRFGLSLSQALDARFGVTTIAAKMTDVPGHTRAMLPHLAAARVRFLHLGVNEASHPPDVPPVFLWRHTDGSEVVVMYHGSYGGEGAVAGLADKLVFAHSGDNLGPPPFQEVIAQHLAMSQRYPGATIRASTMDAYARALLPHAGALPVVTSEIGDHWIHGAGTDPHKVAQYRTLLRLREKWLRTGWNEAAFSRKLILVPEHTWGMDIKTHLNDHVHFSAADVQAQRDSPRFRKVARSWAGPRNPLALLRYQTFDAAEFERFQRAYNTNYGNPAVMWWAASDFGKPGLERTAARSAFWQPTVGAIVTRRDAHAQRLRVLLEAPAQAHTEYGCPRSFTLEYALPDAEARVEITLQWFGKPATRFPEATWLSFSPRVRARGAWLLDKMGQAIDPLDVVRYGSQHLHAVGRGARWQDDLGAFALDTLDAPLLSPGAPGLLRFGRARASVAGGMHVNLHNTVWGTNFPQWYGLGFVHHVLKQRA